MLTPSEIYAIAWQSLVTAVNPGQYAYHLMTLATVGTGGMPQARLVVMREANPAAGTINFHTDARSPKWAELKANPSATLLWYDPATSIQLRAGGTARLHNQDELARVRWEKSRKDSRACYGGPVGSSCVAEAPPIAPTDSESGWPHFGVVVVELHELEWLHLIHTGHQRLRFGVEHGRMTSAQWLVP